VARSRQQEGEIPALWQRIAVSAALAAPLGWIAEAMAGAGPGTVGAATGAMVGAMGLRPEKVAMGPVVGAAVGQVLAGRHTSATAVASSTVLAYHTLSPLVFRPSDGRHRLLATSGTARCSDEATWSPR
jgi:hypothetical protein